MLARLARELPVGDYFYEPKWDGFRALAARDGEDVDLRSRHGRPLARYFPEVVDALLAQPAETFVLDGEIVAHPFPALMARLHPAASRVERLARETPAELWAFDVLAVDAEDLLDAPFAAARPLRRRRRCARSRRRRHGPLRGAEAGPAGRARAAGRPDRGSSVGARVRPRAQPARAPARRGRAMVAR